MPNPYKGVRLNKLETPDQLAARILDPALPKRARKPDRVRLVLEEYDSRRRGYREVLSLAGIPVRTKRERNRLWRELQDVVDDRDWTDRNVARSEVPSAE